MKLNEGTKELIERVRNAYLNKKREIIVTFLKTSNPYKQDDIIKDSYHIIKITKISYRVSLFENNESGEIMYTGVRLKKDLTPFINQDDNIMYLCNVKEKLN